MTGWAEIVAGLIRAFNLIAGWVRDDGLIRRGAERAEVEPSNARSLSGAKPMRSTSVLFLIATAPFSTACSGPVSVEMDCAWAQPIRFGEATKDWFSALSPWPDHVRADLEKIARHNEKHEAFAGEDGYRSAGHLPNLFTPLDGLRIGFWDEVGSHK